MSDLSSNEVEMLILKAARGGGMALGYAEDLAATAPFLDLDSLGGCPCAREVSGVARVQTALDLVLAGEVPQTIEADGALISAMVTAAQIAWQKRLIWCATATGAVFERFEEGPFEVPEPQGRRALPPTLEGHLRDMAAKLLVPETEASRSAGAGAGLTDND